jgi:hypothetical protein
VKGQFVCVPVEILTGNFSPGAITALLGLLSFHNRKTGQYNPSLGTLAKRLTTPAETVRRWVRELRRAGIVISTANPGSSNSYSFSFQSEHFGVVADVGLAECTPCSPKPERGVHGRPTEPDVFELEKKTTDADETVAVVVQPERHRRRSAAAAVDASHQKTQTTQNASTVEAQALVEDLIAQHPEPGNPSRAVDEAAKLLSASPDSAATIRRNHAAWREHWATLDRQRFIPQLWRWLSTGEWKYAPAARRSVERETYAERWRRELRELDEREYRQLAEDGEWETLEARGQDPEVWRAKIAS